MLEAAEAAEAVSVLAEAFRDYPVMRYVLGPGPGYDRRLEELVVMLVAARTLRHEPVLGVRDHQGVLLGAATVELPRPRTSPAEFAELREATWARLGADARGRYETYGASTSRFVLPEPHHFLHMIGVRQAARGTGLARPLLEAVHQLAADHPDSTQVVLTTEQAANVSFYQHFGYRLLSRVRVADQFETWGFARPVPNR